VLGERDGGHFGWLDVREVEQSWSTNQFRLADRPVTEGDIHGDVVKRPASEFAGDVVPDGDAYSEFIHAVRPTHREDEMVPRSTAWAAMRSAVAEASSSWRARSRSFAVLVRSPRRKSSATAPFNNQRPRATTMSRASRRSKTTDLRSRTKDRLVCCDLAKRRVSRALRKSAAFAYLTGRCDRAGPRPEPRPVFPGGELLRVADRE